MSLGKNPFFSTSRLYVTINSYIYPTIKPYYWYVSRIMVPVGYTYEVQHFLRNSVVTDFPKKGPDKTLFAYLLEGLL